MLEGGSVLISKAKEDGTEALIRCEVVEGGKDRISAWVIRTAITERVCQTGRGDFNSELLPLEVMTSAYSKKAVTIRTCVCHKTNQQRRW